VERPLGGAVDAVVVALVAVGEAVDDDEVEDGVVPALVRLDGDRACGFRGRGRSALRLRSCGAASRKGDQTDETREGQREQCETVAARIERERPQTKPPPDTAM
jgi:hypothetical protein